MQNLTIELTQQQAYDVAVALEGYIRDALNSERETVEDLIWLSDLLDAWKKIKTAWEGAPA